MSGSRPGEVSPRWAAKVLGVDVQTIWRWCRDGVLQYRRPELGRRRRDGTRHVKRYWLAENEIAALRDEGLPD